MELSPGGDDPMRPNHHNTVDEGATRSSGKVVRWNAAKPMNQWTIDRLFPYGIGDSLYPHYINTMSQPWVPRPPPVLVEEWRDRPWGNGIEWYQPQPDSNPLAPHVMALVPYHFFTTHRNTRTGDGPYDYESIIDHDPKTMCSIQ